MGGEPSEYTLIHNTSEGMNILSYGLNLPPGSKILLLENEYPSNYYPFEHLLSKGHTIEFVRLGENPDAFLENFERSITPNTHLVSFSAVHWCTGMPLPLEAIGKICKDKNIFFAVDGAQGVGHIPIHVKQMNIDYMAFSSWKWLLGPLGLGVLYVSSEKLNSINLSFKGTDSVMDSENYLPYRDTLKVGSDRFMVSTPSFSDWVYFKASLEILSEIGYPQIYERIYSLTSYLGNNLLSLGFSLNTQNFNQNTGILVAKKKYFESKNIVNFLKSKKVVTADRLGGVRFSPHVYNSREQLDVVIDLLGKYTA